MENNVTQGGDDVCHFIMSRGRVFLAIIVGILGISLCSCIGTRAEYSSPSSRSLHPGLYVTKYNHVLSLGLCGMPWNYNRIYYIKLLKEGSELAKGDFEVTDDLDHPLLVNSGHVHIDYDKKECDITIKIIIKLSSGSELLQDLEVNGHYHYELSPGL